VNLDVEAEQWAMATSEELHPLELVEASHMGKEC
jgi:hypothetical protein